MPTTEVKDRLKELRKAAGEIEQKNDEIVSSIEGDGTDESPLLLTPEKRAEFQKNNATLAEIKAEVELLQAADEFKQWSQLPADASVAVDAAALRELMGIRSGGKGLGALFTESEQFKAFREQGRGASKMDVPFAYDGTLDVFGYGRKDVYTDLPSGDPGSFGTVQRDPMVTRPQRRRRVRDLFPVVRTTARVIEYFTVSGYTNAASAIPERDGSSFAYKPKSQIDFTGSNTTVRTIAHWEPAHRDVLDDEPQLQNLIETELLYGLRLHEDYQILNGTGTGQDLLGILNTPGRQQYSWSEGPLATDGKHDAVRRAMTKVLLADYEPTGVVVHPNDWEDMELAKASDGHYLLAIAVATGAEPRIWRLPVVDTAAIDEGTGLVGAFGLGSTLYDRAEANVRIADQHADFFIQNAVAILVEERLGLATKRPEAFVEITFDEAPTP